MATSINSYSVNFGMDASGYVNGANLSRQETKALIRDIEAARTPAEQYAREQDRLTEALRKGAITQETYRRLLDHKKQSLGLATTSIGSATSALNPYTLALTAATVATTAAVTAGVAFVSHLREVQNQIDNTVDAAGKLGVSYNELTSLRFAAQEGGGVDAATVDASIKKMQINISKAIAGDEAIQKAFGSLGLSAGELMKAGPLDATMQIADALQGVNDQGEKLRLTMEIFGKSGTELVSTLDQGSAAIQESIDFQQKWNSLTDEQVAAVSANNDAWDRVNVIVEGLSTKLAAEFAPAMQLVADYILDGSEGFAGIDGAVRLVVDNTVYFAGAMKDVFELATVTQTTLANIASLNFSAVASGISEALTFDSGSKALDALNAKRQEIASKAADAERQREEKKKQLALEDIQEVNKAKEKLEEDNRRKAEAADKKRTEQLSNSLKLASKHFEDEAAKQKKIRDDVAKGPGSGMEAGSAEAARFMADQVNKALGNEAVPDNGKPTESQLLDEAKRQTELAEAQAKKADDQIALLKKLTEKPSGLKNIREEV